MTDDARSRALAFADELAERCSGRLGDTLVSVILHGSLTLGDFTPGRSDIDVLAITQEALTGAQLAALRDSINRLVGVAPRRVDLRVVTRATAAKPTPVPPLEAAIVLRPGSDLEFEPHVTDEPDVAVELSIARAHGRNIVGLRPDAVIGPVPAEWVLDIGDRQLAAWQRLTNDALHAELMVLSACRIWRFGIEQLHCSKAAAAHWALARESSLTVVEDALRQRTVDPARVIEASRIAHLLALARRELKEPVVLASR
jgi:predicted nucleotidyltransferase